MDLELRGSMKFSRAAPGNQCPEFFRQLTMRCALQLAIKQHDQFFLRVYPVGGGKSATPAISARLGMCSRTTRFRNDLETEAEFIGAPQVQITDLVHRHHPYRIPAKYAFLVIYTIIKQHL